jgi:hypothetical protein
MYPHCSLPSFVPEIGAAFATARHGTSRHTMGSTRNCEYPLISTNPYTANILHNWHHEIRNHDLLSTHLSVHYDNLSLKFEELIFSNLQATMAAKQD